MHLERDLLGAVGWMGQSEELELDGPEIKDPFFRISICFSRPLRYRVGMFMKSVGWLGKGEELEPGLNIGDNSGNDEKLENRVTAERAYFVFN
jgi:hypothetical protein